MKSSISRASLFVCLLRVVPWVPHGNDRCCKQQPQWVMSRATKVGNSMRSVKSRTSLILGQIRPFASELLTLERWKIVVPETYIGDNIVRRIAPSLLIKLSSNLRVTRTTIKFWTSSNSGQIEPFTSELLALCAENHHVWPCLNHSLFSFDQIFMRPAYKLERHRIIFKLAGNQDSHKMLDEFEFRPDQTFYFGVTCLLVPKSPIIDLVLNIACLVFNETLWNLQITWKGINSDNLKRH